MSLTRVSNPTSLRAVTMLLIGVLLRAPDPACGEDPSNGVNLTFEELTGKEVSTAAKHSQRESEAMAAVTVIPGVDIRKFGYRTLGDALSRVIGLTITNDRTYQYLGVRGFNFLGDYGGRVLFLVDGHRVNDPNYDYVSPGEEFNIDVESIEKIEVIKGTGSALWGANAVVATVNVITKNGRSLNGTNVKADYGTFNRRKFYADTGSLTRSGIEYAFGGGLVNSDGEKNVTFPIKKDDSEGFFTEQNGDGYSAARGYARVSYNKFNLLLNASRRTKYVPGAPYETVINGRDRYTDHSINLELSSLRELGNEYTLLTRVYHDWIGYHGYLFPLTPDNQFVKNIDSSVSKMAGSELRLAGPFLGAGRITTGLEYQQGYLIKIKNEDSDPPNFYYAKRGDYRLASGYTELNNPLTENLSLVLGGRIDKYSVSRLQKSPRIGMLFSFGESSTIRLLHGRAFRIPNNNERNVTFRSTEPLQTRLTPEIGIGQNAILSSRITATTKLQFNLFRYDIKDIIKSVAQDETNTVSMNKGSLRSRGAELWLQGEWPDSTSWYAGFSLLKVRPDEGPRPPNSQRSQGSAGISLPLFNEKFAFSPEIRFLGPVYTLTGAKLPERVLINTTLTAVNIPHVPGLQASLSIYNLFGANNPAVAGPQYKSDWIPSEGRTLRLQLSKSF
jgi:outer membrane receptor for ferrienterochelin and colicins